MFNAITWEAFLTTVILLVGGYYFITTFLLYHKEITSWVKSRAGQPQETASSETEVIEDKIEGKGILGKVNSDDRLATPRSSTVSAEDLSFGSSEDEGTEMVKPVTASQPQRDHLIIGSVADLLQEIKTLIQLITEYNSDKAESASLFRTLLLRYPHVKSTEYKEAISLYICQAATQFSFTLDLQEANNWWEEERDTRK